MTEQESNAVKDAMKLTPADRWKLYRFWVEQFCQRLHHLMEPLKQKCQNAADRYKEANGLVDKYIFENSAVIGLTTTGAARYHSTLSAIQPPVIIVEEAAEVLEGHIVTSLSPGCQHLILIGDHQQLRPSPNVFELARHYHLDLSLFERMVNNGLHCDTLELQHRMRPSISKVMKHIYKNLKDHKTVQSYDNVMGVSENIFFINHNIPESENIELLSHLNEFEARYLTGLCQYLLKQGYSTKQITVLSTYSAQVSCLRTMLRKEAQEGLLITAVDNYQGEENDIILLSLVRSNKEKKIGFLKIDNRICVALSRAKIGMYVIGNFDLLSNESPTWKNIIQDLERSNQVGRGLGLYCQTHPESGRIEITEPEMFKFVPEGGCMRPCQFMLNCGHVCTRKCHVYDPMHIDFTCMKMCERKVCDKGHPCPAKCFEECPPCSFPVPKEIPTCGHVEHVPCHVNPKDYKCTQQCDEMLPCGHKCGTICGYDHICYETIKKIWPCGHEAEVLCMDKETARCPSRCHAILKCGHLCQSTCQECHEGRLHMPCREHCDKTLVCGHECTSSCSRCPPCTAACESLCLHVKCHQTCNQECKPCEEPCSWSCAHYKCKQKCSDPCDRLRCDKRCRKPLSCKHTCIGLCGERCPSLCRKCNSSDLEPFVPQEDDITTARFVHLDECGHVVEVQTMDFLVENLQEMQLPSCPWCSTIIRRNTRYGTIVKKALQNIESVKRVFHESILDRIQELRMRIEDDNEALDCGKTVKGLLQFAQNDETCLAAVKYQTELLLQYHLLKRKAEDLMSRRKTKLLQESVEDLNILKKWLTLKRYVFTEQEKSDAKLEIARIENMLYLEDTDLVDASKELLSVEEQMEQIRGIVCGGRPLTEEKLRHVKHLKRKMHQRPLADENVVSVQLSQWKCLTMERGQWKICPKSHVYTRDDTDNTTEESCPMCESENYDSSGESQSTQSNDEETA